MKLKPDYVNMEEFEFYCNDIEHEYTQCIDEGLDISAYKCIFDTVKTLPKNEIRKKFTDVLFEAASSATLRDDYKFIEPSQLEEIKLLRKEHIFTEKEPSENELKEKIAGAWLGRVCGCLLGKPVEGIRTEEFIPLLRGSGNYPLHRYILTTDITEEMYNTYNFYLKDKCYADTVHGMPVDDDTNYVVLAQKIIELYGRNFEPHHIAKAWIKYQSRESYFTAERVAFDNFIKGYAPPASAIYKNPYREWIGAQIRGDYFGYINPGNPEKAAEMAFRDASVSHIKNGIYGEMWASAMISCAAVTDNIEDIIRGGLSQIPHTSRLYEAITCIISMYKSGKSYDDCVAEIHSRYDEHTSYGWCHTIPNAMIVAAALLYGEGDFGQSICMAVQPAFDTDCNGATVGSVIGMRNGKSAIGEEWTKPVENTIHTSILGVGTVKISDMVEKTIKHLT